MALIRRGGVAAPIFLYSCSFARFAQGSFGIMVSIERMLRMEIKVYVAAAKWEQSEMVDVPVLTLSAFRSFAEAQGWLMEMFDAAKTRAAEILSRHQESFAMTVCFGGEYERSNHFAIFLRRRKTSVCDSQTQASQTDLLLWQGDMISTSI